MNRQIGNSRQQFAAFTLTEILVVLAIIGLISGILFPVLARAKRSAKIEVGKQYLRQQFMTLDMYSIDSDGVYPSYSDIMASKPMQAPCSPLYDWKTPCWAVRPEIVSNPIDDAPRPTVGGRGYLYAIRNWLDVDKLGKDQFLGWDRTKPYPILCDIFAAQYRVMEFDGAKPDLTKCNKGNGVSRLEGGCLYPDTIWYAYSDGSLKVSKRTVDAQLGKPHQLFDWVHVFMRQMDSDSRQGN